MANQTKTLMFFMGVALIAIIAFSFVDFNFLVGYMYGNTLQALDVQIDGQFIDVSISNSEGITETYRVPKIDLLAGNQYCVEVYFDHIGQTVKRTQKYLMTFEEYLDEIEDQDYDSDPDTSGAGGGKLVNVRNISQGVFLRMFDETWKWDQSDSKQLDLNADFYPLWMNDFTAEEVVENGVPRAIHPFDLDCSRKDTVETSSCAACNPETYHYSTCVLSYKGVHVDEFDCTNNDALRSACSSRKIIYSLFREPAHTLLKDEIPTSRTGVFKQGAQTLTLEENSLTLCAPRPTGDVIETQNITTFTAKALRFNVPDSISEKDVFDYGLIFLILLAILGGIIIFKL